MADGNTAIASYTISGAIVGSRYIDADGETIFDITLAKSIFKIGVNNVSAAYTKIGSIRGNQGTATTITYDNTPPSISVQNPDTNPTLQKEVRATDNESGTTAWKYKVLTESIQVCNSATMNAGTTDYTEGNIIVFENTNDNGSRVCFSTTDAAGNTAYLASETLSGIDGSAPTVESVVTTSADRRTAQVILNEKVYATTTPTPSDFKVIVDNSEYPIVGIAELATSTASAKNTFTITLPSVPSNTQMALKYTQGTNKIIDIIGNQLASFTGQAVNNMKIVSLNLDAIDDTGPDSTDNITRFDGDTVTLTASLNEGTFSNGDIIRLFRENNSTPVQIYTISNLLTSPTYKNATGEIRFTADLPKHIFSRGLNNLSATYTPSGDNEGMRGGTLAITYDITEPKITVQNPSSSKEQQKIVSATDTDSAATVWQYKQIDGADVCDATSMTDAAAYSEGATTIVLGSESDNGTKVCFSATDIAGNTSYKASNQLSNIDTTAPTTSGASITTTARATTKVLFNEPIYATANINPNDFRIVSGQTQYIVTGITGLANSSNSAETSFTLAHVPLSETDTVNLQYTKGSTDITDIAGNALQSFTEAVANRAFVTLALDPQDDTGTSTTDGITQFNGDEVSLTISLTSGTFTNGDQIQIFHKKEEASLLKRIIIASAGTGTVNAGGTASFTTTIAKQLFTREGEVTLYATYTPAGQITSTNGIDFSLTYDDTAPFMTIFEPDTTIATKKQIVVRDYDRSTTTGLYKIIEHDTTCDASALSEDTTPYIEGSTLDITSNDANGKKVCFSFTDTAGNSGYRASSVLQGIDSIAPTVSSAVIENYDRTRTMITFNEKVYASDDFTPSEFSIEIGNTGYNHRVSDVERLPTASNNAIKALLLIHPAVSEEIESRITYTPGTGTIQDIAGNTLKEFTKVIENTSFITLDLADEDDTGSNKNDNYTRLEGSTVTLTVRLTNNATFSNSDVVTIYKEYNDRTRTVMKKVTVSTFSAQDAVNAHNNDSFAIEIPKNLFAENATTALSAGYAPFGNSGLNKVGSILQITVDTKDPTITITEADAEISAKKTISATGRDATETVWKYAQIQSGVVCNADALEFGKEYTKGTIISLDNESYNNTKICFSATDLAGNTTYKSSNSITGIDTEAPTVSSVSVTGRDELIVTMSEPVYAVRNPNPDDFVVFINNSPVTTTAITGIQNIARRATHEFSIIIDDTIRSDDTVSLSYIGSSRSNNDELVKDVIGNTLATFDKITSTLPSVLTIELNPADDTGINTADGITRFSESPEVKFIVTLNKGTFKGGDQVRIYKNNENKPIASVIVGIRGNEVNAHGETSLTATIAKKQFTEGPLTLHATYKPRLEEEGLPSALLSITYDMTAPSITTTNPEKTSAKSKSVSAIDRDSTETSWTYKQITSGATCNAEEMSNGTQPYTEGEKITFNEESDNNNKVCFSAIDQAGNAGYERSAVLKNIDKTAPTITIVNPDVSIVSSSKKISATDNEKDSQWTYQQISENTACDASTTVAATSYTEGTDLTFDKESDNNTKVCFTTIDVAGNAAIHASVVLMNIKEDALTITATTNPWTDFGKKTGDTVNQAQAKAVIGTDGNDTETTWFYKQIAGNATCSAAIRNTEGVKSYTEGEPIILREETDNGTKICFISVDRDGKITATASEIISGVDITMPTIIITETTKSVSARDTDATKSTWTYKRIAGNAACDADQMTSGAETYTEAEQLPLNTEQHSGTKVCFSATDVADNTSYKASETLSIVSATVNSWVDPTKETSDTVNQAQAKAVIGTDGNDTETTWFYKQIAGNATCSAAIRNTEGVKSYTEGEPIILREETDNGTKICFISVDRDGKITATASEIISGVDITMPTIIITETTKSVSARDTDATKSTWTYKRIAGNAACDADQMTSGAETYTEAEQLPLNTEQHSGTKVCFSATDVADNTSYKASETLSIVSATVNSWVDPTKETSDTVNQAQAKAVIGTDGNDTETTWFYKQIAGNATCSAAIRNTEGVKSYTEGEPIILREETDNGTKICFISVDRDGKITATASEIISGVDITMPTIIITETTKSVSARDTDATKSTWTYKRIAGNAACDADQMTSGAETYTEAEQLPLNTEQHSGTKVCFSATDVADNTSYKASETLSIVSATVNSWVDPTKETSDTVNQAQAKAVIGTDGNDTETTWFYKQIAGNATCSAAIRNTEGVKSYTEGEPIILREETDNGTKICFISVNQEGSVSTIASEIISGIDTTMPTIIITNPTSDPAQEKVIVASDRDSGETSWQYKQVTSETTCSSDAFASATQEYTENTSLRFTKDSDNNTKVCFSVTDSAGNTAYATSDVLTGIDATAPTISSARLIDVNKTQTKITVNEHIYTDGTIPPSNFKIEIEGVLYPATKISRFERSIDGQETSFIITHPAIASETATTLSYVRGDVDIVDAVGNALKDFSGQPLFDKSFVALSLDRSDDTGISTTDGITNFDDNEVTLIATISEGTFSNGDVVNLHKKGTARSIERILISGGLVDATNAHGESTFEIVIPRSTFTPNKETVLYTVYTPADGSNSSGQRGFELTISYRTTAPQITVTTSDVSASTTTVQAVDKNEAGETTWHYKQIKSNEECTAETLSQEAHAYTEGTEISFRDETTNDTKACFSSVDIAGNTSYATSDVIIIDLTAPSITVQPLTNTPKQAKIVRASDNDEQKTTWKYRVVKAEEVCDADTLSKSTRSYREGSGLKFDKEQANGHKVCFSSTDTSGNVLYAESMTIQGIDTTAPRITVTMEGAEEKIIRARDTDATESTSWKYRVIKANESCTAETIQENSRTYREGSGLVFRNRRANGYKVCFAASDSAGNMSYRTSNTMQGIGKTSTGLPSSSLSSSNALQDKNLPTNTASPLTPLSNPLYPVTKTP